jgi:hypothetical protein
MGKAIGKGDERPDPYTPATLPALLRTLHIDDKPAGRQRATLRGWLIDHPPGKELRISLCSNGYGLLLRDLGADTGAIPPITATHKLGA